MNKNDAPHIRVHRVPKRARYDRESIDRVLDRGSVAHIAFIDDGQPFCIPTLYARVGDRVLIHGSTASRMVRRLAAGAPACLAVTILDGLVLARSAFHHSANYDSAVLFGTFTQIAEDEKLAALRTLFEALIPDRWHEVRAPSHQELKGTQVLALSIGQAAVKTRSGPPDDDGSADAQPDVWTGVLPMTESLGRPPASLGLQPAVPASASAEPHSGNGARMHRQDSAPLQQELRPPGHPITEEQP